ncbi:MAG: hypothetical protein PVI21_05895 [Candidatus Woesebacteria bacterium]|jgi:hypothetical protein
MRTAGYVAQLTSTSYAERQQADEFVAKIGKAVMFDRVARAVMLKTLAASFAGLSAAQKDYIVHRAIPAITSLAVAFELAAFFGPYVSQSL